MKISAIITAGGSSSRFGGNKNKLLEKINSKEIIKYSVEKFLAISEISEIIITANNEIIEDFENIFKDFNKVKIIKGGASRQESVYNGLCNISCDYVLIHDGARPLISKEIIKDSIQKVQTQKALTIATKTTDTIKQVDTNGKIIKTLDRSFLYNTQTPQVFEYELIKNVHEKLKGQNFTDDAGMVESLGIEVFVLEGDYRNIKITTQNDLDIAKVYLSNNVE